MRDVLFMYDVIHEYISLMLSQQFRNNSSMTSLHCEITFKDQNVYYTSKLYKHLSKE